MDLITVIRPVFGAVFLLFLPGLARGHVLFKRELDAAGRITLSFGLSTAMSTLAVLFLNRYLWIKIDAVNSLLIILGICTIALVILWQGKGLSKDLPMLRSGLPSTMRNTLRKLKKPPSKNTILLLLILLLAAYLNHIPHAGYDYPVHRDEWDLSSTTNFSAFNSRYI